MEIGGTTYWTKDLMKLKRIFDAMEKVSGRNGVGTQASHSCATGTQVLFDPSFGEMWTSACASVFNPALVSLYSGVCVWPGCDCSTQGCKLT